MFRNTLPSPLADTDVIEHPADLIPLSHLELDLPAPQLGWPAYLAGRDIVVTIDDIGRLSVSRDVARQLLTEHSEAEARNREVMERREQQFIQQDQLRRASLPSGIPAGMVPDGMTGAETMILAGEKRRPRSVHEQLLEKELSHTEPELIYQSFGPDEG